MAEEKDKFPQKNNNKEYLLYYDLAGNQVCHDRGINVFEMFNK
jgi:hypothetical protein